MQFGLCYIADYSRIRLGCSVSLLPLNNPVRTAEDYVMADVLSHGRLDFGVGRGLYKYDYDIANAPMSESRDPVQQPTPPIWVAAVRTRRLIAGPAADGFNLLTAPFFFPDHREASKEVMAVYHMYCAGSDAEVAEIADPALRRYQAFTKATDLSRQAYRDPVAYKDWKGFFENRETITLEQMKATHAVIGSVTECTEKVAMLTERFGITKLCFEVNYGALPHAQVMRSLQRFAEQVMSRF